MGIVTWTSEPKPVPWWRYGIVGLIGFGLGGWIGFLMRSMLG